MFISDVNGEKMDADMRKFLTRLYGNRAAVQENEGEPVLKLIWQLKGLIVNYWFMEEELSLQSKYTAGFGVTAIA